MKDAKRGDRVQVIGKPHLKGTIVSVLTNAKDEPVYADVKYDDIPDVVGNGLDRIEPAEE